MAAIVLIFIASTLLMWLRLNATKQAERVASNGGPSVRYLAAARTHLREEREAAGAYMFRSGGARSQSEMQKARRRLEADFAAELKTPSYPGEKEGERLVAAALADLDGVARLLRPSSDWNETKTRFLAFQSTVDRLDDRLAQLEDHDAAFLQSDADSLFAKQRGAIRLILLLDGISLLLAAAVTLILIGFLRHYLGTMAQRHRELEMFSTRVAHDLMSPLATVSIALGANRDKLHDEASVKLTSSALAALKRVRDVVDGLLHFAQSGGKPTPGVRAAVHTVLEGVLEDARPAAEREGIELTCEPFAPCEVACEPGVLGVLVSNLINNAIKFMDESRLRRIAVRVRAGSKSVRVEIEDTGPGFPRSFEAIIFNPYVRATTKAPGLGLGLATVKRLVDNHGGVVGIDRREGSGTLFWFELPRPQSPAPLGVPSPSPQTS
jgi:signal transduction histidine kinase